MYVPKILLVDVSVTTARYVIGVAESIGATASQFTVIVVAVQLLRSRKITIVGLAAVVVTDRTFDGALAPIALTARTLNEYAVFAVNEVTFATVVEVVSCLFQLPAV